MYRIDAIDRRIAELDEKIKAEIAIENRILSNVSGYYSKQTREKAPEAPNKEIIQMIDDASKVLQLQPLEVKMLENQRRANMLINPCAIIAHSPTYRCSFLAASMHSHKSQVGSTSASCTTNPATFKNEFNPKASAYGFGTNGYSCAVVYSWAWYEITPGYPSSQTILVDPLVNINGYYILNNAHVSLFMEARGYQYDPSFDWGHFSQTVLDKTGTTMGRFDSSRRLQFTMPVGAVDPFQILVLARLTVEARGSGANATANFASGEGNTITSVYANTNSLS